MCACWGFLYPFLQGKEEEKDQKKVTVSLACSAIVQVNEERKRKRGKLQLKPSRKL